MKNKQKAVSKIITLILFISVNQLTAQTPNEMVKTADSLFVGKQYTQSLELYEQVLKQHHHSPAMLLKMAYIEEGLGQLSKSLYYLNLYYLASDDEQALVKMEELANKHRLQGYKSNQARQLSLLWRKYDGTIINVLIGCTILLFALLFYLKRQKRNLMPVAMALLIFLTILFIQINLNQGAHSGIVHFNSTYLMSGPSAGSSVVGIVEEGHMLDVVGKKDVWVRAKWMNQEVYIKEDQILMVEL